MIRLGSAALGAAKTGINCDHELVGETAQTPKLQRQIEQIQKLPRTKQRFVMQMLDTVLQQAS